MAGDNPLLDIGFEIPFDGIEASAVEPAITELLRRAREAIDVVAQQSGPCTYDDTIDAMDAATRPLERALAVIEHLESVASTDALRHAYETVQPRIAAFFAELPHDERVWSTLQRFAHSPQAAGLDATRNRRTTKLVDDFRRRGADLEPDGKRRLAEIDVELAELANRFSRNVLDARRAWSLLIPDPDVIDGLPPAVAEAARLDADRDGLRGWRFTLQDSSYIPLLTYVRDGRVREQVWRANNTRATAGAQDNRDVVRRILQLRAEKARLLDYATFADLVLGDRMVSSTDEVLLLLEDLRAHVEPAFLAESEALQAFRHAVEGPHAAELEPWDIAHYAHRKRREELGYDDEEIRPYLPLRSVIEGMFMLTERLFGLTVEPAPDLPKWHPDIRGYRLRADDGTLVAAFYIDVLARPEKREGAWMHGLITGCPSPPGRHPHLATLCASIPAPADGSEPLLTHRELRNLFHELGHLLHHCAGRVEIPALGASAAAWDFVELPSQLMESWCWERPALDLFARHHETDEPMPADLFEALSDARQFRAATAMMRQLGYATVDLALHAAYDPFSDEDPLTFARGVLAPFHPTPLPEDYAMIASFTHLFAHPVGYAAGYYAYPWSEMLAADVFTLFEETDDVLHPAVGRAFRDAVLARGASRDPMSLFEELMGRPPSADALYRRLGV